ncbi:hypothetical protein KX729_19165 [Rhizobium sp. XQZ8]|uniref:hypothetical protein n=1 Tax=Rhizobium populisoli TaxID=2859785 RepID=UPI001CA5942D|nr:hypothetical protein [Rhizobium populisoli]MBW6423582.1 hypothetical protein [Rhizobium populisoli]
MDPAASNGLIGVAVIAAFLCFGFVFPFYVNKRPKRTAPGSSGSEAAMWVGSSDDGCHTGSHSGTSCDSGGGDGGGGGD